MTVWRVAGLVLAAATGAGIGVASLATLRVVVRRCQNGSPLGALALQAGRWLAIAALLLWAARLGAPALLAATLGAQLARLALLGRETGASW
jgi:hypothetical protein